MHTSTTEHCSIYIQLQLQQMAHHMHLKQEPSASSEQWMECKLHEVACVLHKLAMGSVVASIACLQVSLTAYMLFT